MMDRAATGASLTLMVHPHVLRHACGFALASAGHDTRALQALGNRNIPLHGSRPVQNIWKPAAITMPSKQFGDPSTSG